MSSDIHPVKGQGVAEAAELMTRYAAILDRRDLDGWASLFSPEASYTVTSIENELAGWPLLYINDDSKSKIEDRVRFVRQFWQDSFNDYHQRHILSAPLLLQRQKDSLSVEQSFALYTTELAGEIPGRSSLLCVGRYLADILEHGDDRKLARLRVVLDTCALTQSLVYPI